MQMNQLIEKSMPEPRLCLFSPLFGRITERNKTKTVCCKKVITMLSAYLQHGLSEKASNMYVLQFNGITSILNQFQKSNLRPSQQNKRISDHFHQVLYESQCGSGGPAQDEVPTAEHPCGGNTLSKSG